jgi:putative tryptophan/tyrosine transport system substrate-binding protein
MQRREFIILLGGTAAAWPLTVRAQQGERVRRVGVLMPFTANDPEGQARNALFEKSLGELARKVGRDLQIDYYWPGGEAATIRRDAAELVALAPDVILSVGSSTTGLLLQATNAIPIVFVNLADPVGAGFVQSLARPGGNATGFTNYEYSMSGKWVELLKQIAPNVTRVAVIRDPSLAAGIGQFSAIQSVAQSLGVELTPVSVRDAGEMERGVAAFARSGNGGLIVTAGGTAYRRDLIIKLASRHKLPAVPLSRSGWRSDLVRARYVRSNQERRGLRRSHPQGREASRHAGPSADQVRASYKSQDGQGARPHRAALAARSRRRSDRISGRDVRF